MKVCALSLKEKETAFLRMGPGLCFGYTPRYGKTVLGHEPWLPEYSTAFRIGTYCFFISILFLADVDSSFPNADFGNSCRG
jgi:hypothetical protein